MEIVSRKEAIDRGLTHYFTGRPCKNGHLSIRETAHCNCLECMKEANERRVSKDPEAARNRVKNWKLRNPERKRQLNKLWAEKNPEKDRESKMKWQKNNPAAHAAKEQRRRATKRNAKPSWFGEFDDFVWKEAADLVILRRAATRIEWHADHMVALAARAACGLHVAENCQVIPAKLNQKKGKKLVLTSPLEWLQHVGEVGRVIVSAEMLN